MSRIDRPYRAHCALCFSIIACAFAANSLNAVPPQTLRLPPIQEHNAALEFAEFAMGGKRLVTADADSIIVWDAESGKALERVPKKKQTARISPSGELLVYGESDANSRTLIVRSLKDGNTVQIRASSDSQVASTEFSRDGNFLMVPQSSAEQWALWNVQDGSLVAQPSLPPSDAKELQDIRQRMKGRPIPYDIGTPLRRLIGWKAGGPKKTPLVLDSRNVESQFSPTGQHYLSVNWHDTGSSTAQASL